MLGLKKVAIVTIVSAIISLFVFVATTDVSAQENENIKVKNTQTTAVAQDFKNRLNKETGSFKGPFNIVIFPTISSRVGIQKFSKVPYVQFFHGNLIGFPVEDGFKYVTNYVLTILKSKRR